MFKKLTFIAVLVLAAASRSDATLLDDLALDAFSTEARGILQVGTDEELNIHVNAGVGRTDTIAYPDAKYISVRFSDFNLPPGDEVIVRSPDSTTIHRYTGKGRNNAGSFIASFVPGDKAIVEYVSTNKEILSLGKRFGYTIPGFARGFPNSINPRTICGTDQSVPAKCLQGSADLPQAYTKSRAVARLLLNGRSLCTGWLAGSEGHFITNQHCVTDAAAADSIDIEFDAESTSCTDECKVALGCKGSVVTSSATFINNSVPYDYAVLKLPSTVDVSKYGYLQLRGSGPQLGEEIYIPQHPKGWAKRIAYTHDDGKKTVITSLHSTLLCGTNQVGYMVDTQGGSSGSPVLASKDNLVVSLHHCGGCSNQGVDTLDLIADLNAKGIVIRDLIVGEVPPPAPTPVPAPTAPSDTPAPAPTPAPTKRDFCSYFAIDLCSGWFWCTWDADLQKCKSRK